MVPEAEGLGLCVYDWSISIFLNDLVWVFSRFDKNFTVNPRTLELSMLAESGVKRCSFSVIYDQKECIYVIGGVVAPKNPTSISQRLNMTTK